MKNVLLSADDNTKRFMNDVAKFYGLKADVAQSNGMTINGYSGGLLVESARVVGDEGGE
jgi:hypothetical protein